MVIYTSGTTGLPKGILNNHLKLFAIGLGVSRQPRASGRTTAATPACRCSTRTRCSSASIAAPLGVREPRACASASAPAASCRTCSATASAYWNYVGEPVHYVLGAIEKQYGGDEERILAEVARNPRNRLRYAVGNGASPPDIDRFTRWLGLEDMFELYGSTEAAISTFRQQGRPARQRRRDHRPEREDPRRARPGVPAGRARPRREDPQLRRGGRRDLPRRARHRACSRATSTTPTPNASKYRDGVYHSGDLGHVVVRDGSSASSTSTAAPTTGSARTARTSRAAQVARLLQEHPSVALAAAYGVPCAVSDELVMAALKLRPGARFDPAGFFDFCERQVAPGRHGPQVVPGLRARGGRLRVHADPEDPGADLKQDHFHRGRLPDAPIYWRRARRRRASGPSARRLRGAPRARFEAAERRQRCSSAEKRGAVSPVRSCVTRVTGLGTAPASRGRSGARQPRSLPAARACAGQLRIARRLGTALALYEGEREPRHRTGSASTRTGRHGDGRDLHGRGAVPARQDAARGRAASTRRPSSTSGPPTRSTAPTRATAPTTGSGWRSSSAASTRPSSSAARRPRRSSSTPSSTTTSRGSTWRSASSPRRSATCAAG